MNKFFIIAALVAVASAKPAQQSVSLSQDTLGNYNLNYNTDEARRSEQGFQDGKVVGSYSYHDTEGVLHQVTYVAAPNAGFVAHGDLPTPVQDTPEVAAARRSHLAVVEKERALLPLLKEEQQVVYVPNFQTHQQPAFSFQQAAPVFHQVYVDNTAELEAAKREHFAAHQQALERLATEYRRFV